MKFKLLLSILALASITVSFSGCGASVKNFKVSADYQTSVAKDNNVAIITDTCLRRDESGEDTDHFSVYNSKNITDLVNSVVTEKLKSKGYKVNYTENRFMCSFYKNPSNNVKLVINEDDEISRGKLPYYHSEIENDEYKNAVQKVLYRAGVSANKENFSKIFFTDKEMLGYLNTIKEYTKQDKLLVVDIKAGEVSSAKKMGQGLKAGLFGGRVSVDYLKVDALLIDLNSNKAIWTVSNVYKNADLFDKDFYEDEYYTLVFKSLENK